MTFWKRFATNRGAVIGLIILIAVIIIAVLAPVIYPGGPWKMVQRPFLVPFTTEGLPLGTDTLGRNVAAGLVHGARVSLLVGLVSTVMALLIGVPLGALAGFYGGYVDEGAMRFTEFFQTIPNFALAIVLVAILQPTLGSITLAIAIVSWPPVARLVRAEVMSLKRREFVEAAHLAGPLEHAHTGQRSAAQRGLADHRHGLAHGRDRDPAGNPRCPSSALAIPTSCPGAT